MNPIAREPNRGKVRFQRATTAECYPLVRTQEKKSLGRYEIFKNRNRCTRADNNCDNVGRISPGHCMQIEEHERYSRFDRKLHIRRVS